MLTVVSVLKSGGEFTPEHVRILRDSVRRYWPDEGMRFRFACLSDLPQSDFASGIHVLPLIHDLPGWWSKMELFNSVADQAWGNRLYFDLDTAITGSLDDLLAHCNSKPNFTILRDFYRPQGYGSGVMFIPSGFGFAEVWKPFRAESYRIVGSMRGDQDYLEVAVPDATRWQDVCPGRIVSFKPVPIAGAKLNNLPKGASVVCFHGHPRPWALPDGTTYATDEEGNRTPIPRSWVYDHYRAETIDEHLYGPEINRTGTHDV